MRREERLISRLKAYNETDMYPFHMPGHKRLAGAEDGEMGELEFPNPFTVDITEIEGFDNLHHPEGILRESMEWAAGVYGADRTYYLVNGSSGGILAAVSAAAGFESRILTARNCHKSVYHAVYLNRLKPVYLYPQTVPGLGIQGGILPEDVEKSLRQYPDTRAVMVVSPTYDGIVSDIHKIAEIVHRAGLPLIVDEAHGAHFRYGREFPQSALELGADLVIQSIHKTLPSLTQTALLHVNLNRDKGGPYVDIGRLERFLQIYQSSSPSYVLMASIENAVWLMERLRLDRGAPGNAIDRYMERMGRLRENLSKMRCLRLAGKWLKGSCGVWDTDMSKVVISTAGTGMTGTELDGILRETYHLEMEMCGPEYATAITSVMDSGEGLDRLEAAVMEIDRELAQELGKTEHIGAGRGASASGPDAAANMLNAGPTPVGTGSPGAAQNSTPFPRLRSLMPIASAMDKDLERVALRESGGRISGEYIYIYPPGIPIVAPGEEISGEALDLVLRFMEQGLPVQGPQDRALEWLLVVRQNIDR